MIRLLIVNLNVSKFHFDNTEINVHEFDKNINKTISYK